MESPWNLNDLEIVGCANVLKETMLPSVVPPVFRLKADAQRVFVPPYSFNAGFLCNATEVPSSELQDLRDAGEITLFQKGFPAIAGFELWIDRLFREHYEPLNEAREKLRDIANQAIHQAEDALRKGDLDQAARFSGIAISADDRRMDPLAIKAAIHRMRRNELGERLMVQLASPFLAERSFALLVENYFSSAFKAVPPAADSNGRRPPMRNAALHRAA